MSNRTNLPFSQSWTGPKARDVWERSSWLWSALFFLGIILGLIFALQDEAFPPGARRLAIGLNILLATWHLGSLFLVRRIGHYRENLPFALVYIVGLCVIWFFLIRLNPGFYITQMGIWSQVFIALPIGWAAVFAVAIFGINMFQQTIGIGVAIAWPVTLMWLGFTAVGVLFGLWIHTIISQSMERKSLIEQLEATRAELAQSEREAGMLAERQRMAHEIHDTLAQGFISIIMHLETAEQTLSNPDNETAHQIQQAKETARHNLQEARRVVADLRPEPLENNPLPAAIERTTQRWSQRHNIPVTMQTTGTPLPLHPDVDVTLLRVTQEALANIHKHAQAQTVCVTLSYMDDLVLLDVQDDGVGLDGAKPFPFGGGFGLQAMRERAAQFGGELLLESDPEGGTTVVVKIPVGD